MGNKQTIFTADKFNSIKACTNFSRSKILSLYKRFRELDPQRIPATMLTRDRTRVEITLFLRRAQPARRDIWICVEKTRRKYPNFEIMRRKCDGFFMGKMTSEVAIRAEIFHGNQTSYLFLFFSVWSAFFPFQTYFHHQKNVISRRVSTRFRRRIRRKTLRRKKRVRVGRVLNEDAS